MILVEQVPATQAKGDYITQDIEILSINEIEVHARFFDDRRNAAKTTPRNPLVNPSDDQRKLGFKVFEAELHVDNVFRRALQLRSIKLETRGRNLHQVGQLGDVDNKLVGAIHFRFCVSVVDAKQPFLAVDEGHVERHFEPRAELCLGAIEGRLRGIEELSRRIAAGVRADDFLNWPFNLLVEAA